MNCACTNTYTCMRHRHPGTKLATQRASHSNSEARKRHPSSPSPFDVLNAMYQDRTITDFEVAADLRDREGQIGFYVWFKAPPPRVWEPYDQVTD